MARRDPSGYDRRRTEDYPTTDWVTDILERNIAPPPFLWEPAAGAGSMLHRLQEHGHKVVGSDIRTGYFTSLDFLKATRMLEPGIQGIVTNPPYANLAVPFVEKALELTKPAGGMVAMLLKSEFDHGKTRRHLFRDCPAFMCQIKLTTRIIWFKRYDGKKEAPQEWHSWFVWDWKYSGRPYVIYDGLE